VHAPIRFVLPVDRVPRLGRLGCIQGWPYDRLRSKAPTDMDQGIFVPDDPQDMACPAPESWAKRLWM
jgi:hypothetical protein